VKKLYELTQQDLLEQHDEMMGNNELDEYRYYLFDSLSPEELLIAAEEAANEQYSHSERLEAAESQGAAREADRGYVERHNLIQRRKVHRLPGSDAI
jgi:hypothetical protein